MVVEGMFTTEAAYELAKSHGVEMRQPAGQIYRVIRGEVPAAAAVDLLMGRERKRESSDTSEDIDKDEKVRQTAGPFQSRRGN